MRAKDISPKELLHTDPVTGLPLIGPARVAVLSVQAISRLVADLAETLGMEKVGVIFTRFGFESGMGQAMAMDEAYDFENDEEWLKASAVLITASGQALMKFDGISIDRKAGSLHFTGTWNESLAADKFHARFGEAEGPVCATLAGLASGYASVVWGSEVLVKETACIASGASVCRFEGRPVTDWGINIGDLRREYSLVPLDEEIVRLRSGIRQANEEMARKNEEIEALKRKARPTEADGIVFRSKAMSELLLLAEKVAPTESTVLIQGESGTGKEVLARYIHARSGRGEEPFMAVNCAALPENLLESELFGHRKGAFTGADSDKDGLFVEAGGGTIFLDEIGECSMGLQAKMLRALQSREVRPVGGAKSVPVRARVITATNRDLEHEVEKGVFRDDLFFRLAVFPLTLPPLRDRREDVLILARHFLGKLQPGHPGFAPEAVRALQNYSWPGNVRELENWVEYALVLSGSERITIMHLPVSDNRPQAECLADLVTDLPTFDELQRRYIDLVLKRMGGNRTEAAKVLGLSQSTLYRRLREMGRD